MARAYSQDLRDRVIDAALKDGTPARHAAARFGIGIATAIRWVRQARESGDRRPGRQGQPRRSKLDPHRAYVLELARTTDMTLTELAERISAERGIAVGRTAVWVFLGRAGLTVKKRPRTPRSRSGRTS